VRSPTQHTKPTSLLWWPAMRAHPSWQRPSRCHISLFSHVFFSLVSFFPSIYYSTHATQALHVFTLPCLQLGTDSSDQHLSDLIIIEIPSNNYQYKEISSRGAVQKRDPAIQPRFRSPSTPPAPVVSVRQQHRDPDLAGTSQL